MKTKKNKRIDYIGFNDFWFITIGVVVLSLITDYLFNNSFGRNPFMIALMNWSISLFFSIFNWFVIREAMIFLRKKFPDFKDDIKRIIIFFLSLIAIVISVDTFGNYILSMAFGDEYNPVNRARVLLPVVLISTMTMAIYEAIYYYNRLRKSVQEEEQAKQVVVQAKLDALRNQAQPHFLFNSLNTLRDIIDQNPREDAKKFVDKLADVYRFILESGKSNLISLRNELKFSKSYIHIQKERFGDNLQLDWNVEDDQLDRMIVPMSLQLLLENAIKHNVASRAKPLLIHVKTKNGYLIVENIIQAKSTHLPSTKLGLKNIEKRYDLISNKSIQVDSNGDKFIVTIPLLKSSNQNKSNESINY